MRRRYFFASRCIQRIYRWLLLLRKTRRYLMRSIAARRLQRWRRMILFRPKRDLLIIRLVIRCGGHTRVFSKLPHRHLQRGKIDGIDSAISMLQKFWFTSRGQMDLYVRFAARKAAMAHQQMLSENASIIQNSYRAHLWEKLMLAARLNNRARRIQRGFRAHQYRYWVSLCVSRSRHRRAAKIQRAWRALICRRSVTPLKNTKGLSYCIFYEIH
jgi:hypothetical protein